jgi:hypothetical protein
MPVINARENIGALEILELIRNRHREIEQRPVVEDAPQPLDPVRAYAAADIRQIINNIDFHAGPGRIPAAPPRHRVQIRRNARLPITNEDVTVNVRQLAAPTIVSRWYAILNVPKKRQFLVKQGNNYMWTSEIEEATSFLDQQGLMNFIEEYINVPGFNPSVELYCRRTIQKVTRNAGRNRNRNQANQMILEPLDINQLARNLQEV